MSVPTSQLLTESQLYGSSSSRLLSKKNKYAIHLLLFICSHRCGIMRGYVTEVRYVLSRWLQHGDYKRWWPPGSGLQLPGSLAVGTQLLRVKEKCC